MGKKMKELFYLWAYLDLERTGIKPGSYFGRFSQEAGQKNVNMMRSISVFFLVVSGFVILSTFTYFGGVPLRNMYLLIAGLELMVFVVCTLLIRHKAPYLLCNVVTSVYILHLLFIGAYIGVVYSSLESATIFVVILAVAPMIFTLPSMLSVFLMTLATVGMLVASYHVKEYHWFQADVINCVGVLIFSVLLGWRMNRIRAEEAFTRSDVLALNEELKRVSITDPLTGLGNHRSFQDTYYKMFQEACSGGSRIGVIMIDIDKFKDYNDNYGHVQGDQCLSAVARAFAQAVGEGTTVYRYGGEEFVMLLSEAACDRWMALAEALQKNVERLAIPHAASEVSSIVTVSMGLYIGTPTERDKPTSFVDRADKAMYCSKEQGRNRLTKALG